MTSVVSRGVFAAYQQGRPGIPTEFVDTIVYPDRNRTDFGKKKKNRVVQANAGDRGWKIDAARGVLLAQTPEEVRGFQRYVRVNIDNVLRRGWREPGVQLRHVGRTEYAPRKWAEVVEIEYPDGLRVELLFDPQTHLPVASRYREGAESGAAGSLLETRFHEPYLDFDGVKVARTVDLYRDGVQTARVIYESVVFNTPIEPGYFDQPANIKDIKDLN